MRDERRVWTIQIEGPNPALIQAPGTPIIRHQPPCTLAQVFCTLPQVGELLQGLVEQELSGTLITPLDKEGPFPRCSQCTWLDRDLGDCSEGRPNNTSITPNGQDLLEHSVRAREDWNRCSKQLSESLEPSPPKPESEPLPSSHIE